jgi:peroxiredoxin
VKESLVVLSLFGLLLPFPSMSRKNDDPPAIKLFADDLHPDLSGGYRQEIPPLLRPSPEFVVRLVDGKQLLLSSFRGKIVALMFMHTTCPDCQEASRVFTKLYSEYGSRDFQPLDVAFNSMAERYVAEFVKTFGVSYPVGFSSLQEVMEYLGLPSNQRFTIPQVVWIDRNGNIRAQTPALEGEAMLTEPYWRSMIETLVNESGKSGGPHKKVTSAPRAKD